MKFEIFIVLVLAAWIYDAWWNGGRVTRGIMSLRRYYKQATWIGGGLLVYFLLKSKNPLHQNMLLQSYDMLSSLPLDRRNVGVFSSIIDMTGTRPLFMEEFNDATGSGHQTPLMPGNVPQRMGGGAGASDRVKRSVSESKKRYVAASQQWRCASCQQQLNHTFEVDHTLRLEYGGSNEVSNLTALCRNCHGLKTAKEVMDRR